MEELYRLRLVKGLSYTNGDIIAHKDNPFIETDDKGLADTLIDTGYFEYAADEPAQPLPQDEPKRFELMNVAELESYAAYHNIDIKGVKGKQNIIKAIIAAQGVEVLPAGSPTMQVLQEEK